MRISTTTVKDLAKLFKRITIKRVYEDMILSPSTKETTITDNIIKELRKNRNPHLLALPGIDERKKGADLEWWILYKHEKENEMQAIQLRIQAKKQIPPTRFTPAKYDKINHSNKHGIQIELLIDGCTNEKAIPLYCFYNVYFEGDTKQDIEDNAWKYAHAEDVYSSRMPGQPGEINSDYKTLDVFAKPIHELASKAQKEAYKILEEFIDKNSGTSIDLSTYIHNRLPGYVLDKLVTNELTKHPFMKQNKWFAGVVSDRKLKGRTKKSNTFYSRVIGIGYILEVIGEVMSKFIMWLIRKIGYGVNTLPIIITISDKPLYFEGKKK